MAEEKTTMDVIVHKANVPMMKGESINQFTNKLSQAGRAHVLRKLNIAEKDGGAWLVEAFQDRVVFSTYKGQEPTKHYAFKYTRADKSGDFEFGGVIEVERMTSFVPKGDMTVTKAKASPKIKGMPCFEHEEYDCATCKIVKTCKEAKKATEQEKACGPGDKAKKVAKGLEDLDVSKGTPEEFGGWKQTQKSFWMGVL